jgi:hypothetical protein
MASRPELDKYIRLAKEAGSSQGSRRPRLRPLRLDPEAVRPSRHTGQSRRQRRRGEPSDGLLALSPRTRRGVSGLIANSHTPPQVFAKQTRHCRPAVSRLVRRPHRMPCGSSFAAFHRAVLAGATPTLVIDVREGKIRPSQGFIVLDRDRDDDVIPDDYEFFCLNCFVDERPELGRALDLAKQSGSACRIDGEWQAEAVTHA